MGLWKKSIYLKTFIYMEFCKDRVIIFHTYFRGETAKK